jgi:hypothetical protein
MSKSEAGGVVEYGRFLANVSWPELKLAARKKRPTFHPETGEPITGHDEVNIVSHEVLAEVEEDDGSEDF